MFGPGGPKIRQLAPWVSHASPTASALSHTLHEGINAIVRERLVSKGYTNAEKSLAANCRPGDVVAFHRPYKRLGVD